MKNSFRFYPHIVFALIFFAFFLLNQQISAQNQKTAFKRISSEQGLSNDGVTDIIRDKKGFMWFATIDGLNRYDGYTFKIIKPRPGDKNSLTTAFVNNLYMDSYGLLWINNASYLHSYNDATNTLNHLLPGTWVTTWCEDTLNSSGPGMWFATCGQGLHWWNRKEDKFTHFAHKLGDPASLISDSLFSILTDADGHLWIGTSKGLNSLEASGKKFKRYLNGPKGQIYELNVDQYRKKGLIWMGADNGLYSYDVKSGNFQHYFNPFAGKNNSNDNDVRTLYLDSKGILWVGMIGGIGGFDTGTNKYFTYDNEVQSSPWAYITKAWIIQEDKHGTVWALSHGAGPSSSPLLRFDNQNKRFFQYPSIPGQTIYAYSMYIDKMGTLWLGTADNGILKIDDNRKPFYNYLNTSERDRNNAIYVLDFSEDSSGEIWIGSSNGLYRFNQNSGDFIHYLHSNKDPGSLSSNYVAAVLTDHSGNVWVSDYGLDVFDRGKKIFHHFQNDPADSNSIGASQVVGLVESRDGTIWIAMNDGTLDEYSVKTNVFKHHYPKSTPDVFGRKLWFSGLLEDKEGIIWLTITGSGLISYNRENNTFRYYRSSPTPYKPPVNLSVMGLWGLSADSKNNLWISTDLGAVRFDKKSGESYAITEQDGIAGQYIHAITEDNKGYIWFGTSKGISRLDPVSGKFRNYDAGDGLAMGKISIGSVYKTREGDIYFGGSNGFVHFYPDSIIDNDFVPPIIITSFKSFNTEVQLDSSISVKKNIHLSYQKNNLSFEFAALNFTSPEKNQYAYKMEGLDKDWIYSGTRRYASYSNLDPGTYIFRVKGSNNDGIWNEAGTFVTIIISPPWWETWWAYSSYALIFVLSLYWIRRYELNRLRLKDKVKMDEAVLKEREETDKMKSRFFANISHEFRTPLTLILGPSEKIISDTSEDIKKDANIIKRNSRRLLQLINQLLDLSKLESGKLKLEASKGNIVSFVKGVALSFESLSESRDITLELLAEKEYIELYFDRDKMMKILTNIISNAFKFTPDDGRITISVKETENHFVEIIIRDTGIGIAKEEIPKLFDMFYQVDSSHTREYEGTGIGLALTKELVELHHGKINVESTKADDKEGIKGWTEFKLEFLSGREHLLDEEIMEKREPESGVILSEAKNLSYETIDSVIPKDSSSQTSQNDVEANEDKTIILVVEDNFDMRTYIKESFNSDYIIEEAINGEQGVRKAEKIIPDLIVSDMMMPKMDGNELVRILKNDEKTSHIPIILLTARAGYEDKLEGLETGADDYLTKPFDIKELQIRVKNLINIRKKLQEKFSKIEFKPVKEKKLNNLDEKFMNRVNEIIEEHIAEEEFNMEEFGEELFMSRMQVYRKLKALTGKSANRYVRTFKLQKARKMIEEKQRTISEIAYSLGFGSPAYFTKCFKDEFGYPPRETIE